MTHYQITKETDYLSHSKRETVFATAETPELALESLKADVIQSGSECDGLRTWIAIDSSNPAITYEICLNADNEPVVFA